MRHQIEHQALVPDKPLSASAPVVVSQRDTTPIYPKEQKIAPDLAQPKVQMAHLEAKLSGEWDASQKRPRLTFISDRALKYSLDRYVETWQKEIERVGNLNYPEIAKQKKMYGTLGLTVNIKADGSLESVEINRSSGYKELDAAAIHTVELAAPFPPNIRENVDILSISRTWYFTNPDQLTNVGK